VPKRPTAPLEAIVPDVAVGVRAAIATLVPFYFASAGMAHGLSWTALGGWFGTLVDPGGSRATRLRVLLTFTLGGTACLALSEISARSSAFAVVLITVAAFGGSLLRRIGGPLTSLGVNLAILTEIGSARASGTPVTDGLFFAAGAAWATMLSTVVWPVWTHLPVRRAVGAVYSEIAAYAADLADCIDEERPCFDPRFSEIARRDRRRIRDAIEDARAMAVAIRARRDGESRLGSNLRVLLGLAESQFPLLVTLGDELEERAPAERADIAEVLAQVHREAAETQRGLLTRVIASPRAKRATLPRAPSVPPFSHPIKHILARLSHASKLAFTLAFAIDTPLDTFDEISAARPLRDAVKALKNTLSQVRDACAPSSPAFRYALRVAGAVCFAAIVGRQISPMHSQWVTVSTFVVLQPYPGATWTRAAERVLGTTLGSLVAVVISMTIKSPPLLLVVMAPLSVAAVTMRPRSYPLFTFFLTPVFVVIATHTPGDWHVAAARVGDTFAGGAIAIIAALAIFPSWEHTRLADVLATMLEAVSRFAHLVLGPLGRPPERSSARRNAVYASRRSTGIALSEAEASLERLLAEPTHKGPEAANAMQLVTYARRLAGALTTLETYVQTAPSIAVTEQATPATAQILEYIDRVLARAELFANGTRSAEPSEEAPEVPESLDPHARALVERVLAHAALIATLASREDGEVADTT